MKKTILLTNPIGIKPTTNKDGIEDGYIITNNHVIQGADDILVRVEGDKEYKAKVIGADPYADLAVLKQEGEPVKELPLPESWGFVEGHDEQVFEDEDGNLLEAKIELEHPIKDLGEFQIKIRMDHNLESSIRLIVTEEKEI